MQHAGAVVAISLRSIANFIVSIINEYQLFVFRRHESMHVLQLAVPLEIVARNVL